MPALLLALLAFAAGCDRRIDVSVLLPALEGRSVIVAAELPGSIEVHARNLPLMRSIGLEARDDARLTVFTYPTELADLRLPEGEIESQADGAPIPTTTSTIQSAQVSADGEVSAWQPIDAPSDRLLAFRFTPISVVDPCPHTNVVRVRIALSSNERPTVLALFDADTALIATDVDGRVFLVTRDGSALEEELSDLDERDLLPTTGAWRSPEGRVFLSGSGGHLAELTRSGDRFIPAILSSSTSTTAVLTDITGTISGSVIEILGVDAEGRAAWWSSDRGSWITTPRTGEFAWGRQIAASSPMEAFLSGAFGYVERIALEREPVPRFLRTIEILADADTGLTESVLVHPTLGPLASVRSDAFGTIYRRDPPVWRSLHGRVALGGVTQIRDAGNGMILWTSPNGFIGFITPEQVCERISVVQEPIVLLETLPAERTAIMVVAGGTDDPSDVYFVDW